mmetsp:Transcript_13142/g.19884  ORF Transcript_13142/g.19884 Transcript_13142/m.19884 type:complete len:273 (+) Transcript_13142:13-831(+)
MHLLQKDKSPLLNKVSNLAFSTSKSRQLTLSFILLSLTLNLYFIFFRAVTVSYDSPDHRNAAQSISYASCLFQNKPMIMKEVEWDKLQHTHSVCLCGVDNFCRCGPSPATDIIAFTPDMNHILLVDRNAKPYGWGTVGGFVEVGEQIEDAARREFKEETHLELSDMHQVHTYSNPHQDPRRPSMSTVLLAQIKGIDQTSLEQKIKSHTLAGDDAKSVVMISVREAVIVDQQKYKSRFAFDAHRTFIIDALKEADALGWIDFEALKQSGQRSR